MNGVETRAEHIDPAQAAAGWGVAEGSRVCRELHITLGRFRAAVCAASRRRSVGCSTVSRGICDYPQAY